MSMVQRHDSYDFDPNLPRVANVKKKQPGELNELDIHRMEAANAVVRYAESRSAVYEPSSFDPGAVRNDFTSTSLTLEHVNGYSGKIATDTNVKWLHTGELVYPASATVVIHDTNSNTQRFFLEHDDDVMSVAIHPKLNIVASGQLCRRAFVLVYEVNAVGHPDGGISFISELILGPNTRGCKSIDFSPDGDLLLCVAADPYHTASIWDWKKAHMLTSARASNAEVFSMRFNPFQSYNTDMVSPADSEYTLISVGARHLKFWTLVPDESIVKGVEGGVKDDKEARALASRLGKWKLECNAASFGNRAKMQDITCVTFVMDGVGDINEGVAPAGRVVCGTEFGSIFIFAVMEEARVEEEYDIGRVLNNGSDEDDGPKVNKPIEWLARGALLNVVRDAHQGTVNDLCSAGSSDVFGSVGKDGMFKIWKISAPENGDTLMLMAQTNISNVSPLAGSPKTLAWDDDLRRCSIGSNGNTVFSVEIAGVESYTSGHDIEAVSITEVSVVVKGHANSVKQVAAHPTLPIFASVGDDRALNIWHSETRGLVSFLKLPTKVCSCAFNPNGRDIAVGLQSGDIHVYSFPDENGNGDWVEMVKKKTGNKEKKVGDMAGWGRGRLSSAVSSAAADEDGEGEGEGGAVKKKKVKRDIKHSVSKLVYSPDGRTLIAACRDYFLYVYDVDNNYKKVSVMKGHSTFVTHMDFSADSRILQSNDAAREILYWDVEVGKQLANSFDLRDTVWASWTCVYGFSVQGIWDIEGGSEQNILSVCRGNSGSGGGDIVVTGDDNNMINLFRYPALKGAQFKSFGGHMSPVCSLCFNEDNSKLFSTGGTDACVFQWRHN